MKRRTLFSIIAALTAFTMIAGTQTAGAQSINNVCCGFTIAANNFIPAGCFPFTVTATWAGIPLNFNVTGNGPNGFQFANCPPVPATLDAITINGTTVTPGSPGNITLAICGTCVFVHCTYDANGCIIIHLSVCPP